MYENIGKCLHKVNGIILLIIYGSKYMELNDVLKINVIGYLKIFFIVVSLFLYDLFLKFKVLSRLQQC